MMFRKPPIRCRRKRFAWLPRYVSHIGGERRPVRGATLVPFTDETFDDGPGYSGKFATAKSLGGMVWAPTEWVTVNDPDGFIWLEWYVEELMAIHPGRGPARTVWRPVPPDRQWNLWHEY